MTFVEAEIASQPECWRRAVDVARDLSGALGSTGERIALVGCGTSWFVGQVAAALARGRRARGDRRVHRLRGAGRPTLRPGHRPDPLGHHHRGARPAAPTSVVRCRPPSSLGDLDTPAPELADRVVDLSFADEQSVVQTRFATSALVLFRASLARRRRTGWPTPAAEAVAAPLDPAWAAARAEHLPRPGLDRRAGPRGGAEVPRDVVQLGGVLPGDGLPARSDLHRRPRP